MEDGLKSQMISRWRSMVSQCRETLEFWRAHDFRVVANGIDVTEAEQAATEARIAHLERLIAAVEGASVSAADVPSRRGPSEG